MQQAITAAENEAARLRADLQRLADAFRAERERAGTLAGELEAAKAAAEKAQAGVHRARQRQKASVARAERFKKALQRNDTEEVL